MLGFMVVLFYLPTGDGSLYQSYINFHGSKSVEYSYNKENIWFSLRTYGGSSETKVEGNMVNDLFVGKFWCCGRKAMRRSAKPFMGKLYAGSNPVSTSSEGK